MRIAIRNRLILFFSMLSISFHACRKIDELTAKPAMATKRDFFEIPPGTDPTVIRIVNEIKRRNDKNEFVSEFATQNGYPLWNKVVKISPKINGRISLKNSQENHAMDNTDTIVFIPLVLDNQGKVKGFIKAAVNDSIYMNYSLEQFYKNYPFFSSSNEVTADRFAEFMMYLNALVFGEKKFLISDKRLFFRSTSYSDTPSIKTEVKVSPDMTRLASLCFTTTVGTITINNHCIGTNPCHPGYCDMCPACVSASYNVTTEFHCSDEEIGGDPTSGSGEGSSGGGSSIPPYYPCQSSPVPLLPGDPLPPCPPPTDDPGWIPAPTPCETIAFLEGTQNWPIYNDNLRGFCSLNTEVAYIYTNPPDISTDIEQGPPGTLGVTIDPTTPKDGATHSHYDDPQKLSVFSSDDFESLYKLFSTFKMKDWRTFTFGLVTSHTSYVLVITDAFKFRDFGENYIKTGQLKFLLYLKYKIHESNTDDENEKRLLNALKYADCGLKVFKGDATMSNFNPIKISDDNSSVVPDPCN